MITKCSKCGLEKLPFRSRRKACSDCNRLYKRAYAKANADRIREKKHQVYLVIRQDAQRVAARNQQGRKWYADLRHEVIMAYGGYACACCGESESSFLTIDHVFNNGAQHRRELAQRGEKRSAGPRILKWLKDNGFPSGFQILCMNCNMGKQRNGGVCPHKTSSLLCAA